MLYNYIIYGKLVANVWKVLADKFIYQTPKAVYNYMLFVNVLTVDWYVEFN